ncbi:hypothetical protein RJ55_00317 [Drechmeria coniospora]|nr:hypothetical protein RJ55_00317 [Drechmeria coniospora]
MTATGIRARRNKVFRSVFQIDVSQPTPLLAPASHGEPFGGPTGGPSVASTARHDAHSAPPSLDDQVRWDRAWHAVTSRIQLPTSVAVEDSFGAPAPESQHLDDGFRDALSVLLHPDATVPRATRREDVLVWHTQQVRQHFVHHVLPLLAACAAEGEPAEVLLSSVRTLEAAHRQYLYGLELITRGIQPEADRAAAVATFRRDLDAVIGNSWADGLADALRTVIHRLLGVVLHTHGRKPASAGPGSLSPARADAGRVSAARRELLSMLESLQAVGLTGERFQVLLAEVMDRCMREFIRNTYAGVWAASDAAASGDEGSHGTPACMDHLRDWIEKDYGGVAAEAFARLGGSVSRDDVERWRDVAVGRLATLRIQELLDIVLHWPESRGGLDDLRSAVGTPQRRLQLTDTFSAALQKRLLHPGRSTLEILQTYMSMIRTFHALDASKVLLDRVVHALQLYLCQRDDAIRIVVTGLLAHPGGGGGGDGGGRTLVELAAILNDATQPQRSHGDDDELDWNDMTWEPDPVDAGVNYKRPKNEDVIGTLIGALGSQDIFIKEFQLIIAERLLSKQASFQQEIKVLGLLKKRFGEHALQNCDVMIKDIYDSRRVDATLRKSLRVDDEAPGAMPAHHTKILSRLFWPSLPREGFRVPRPVAEMQSRYEHGFGQLKTSRKLSWLDLLGSATIRLELADRSVELECKTYEASIIHAFQDDGSGTGTGTASSPRRRTFDELWEELRMDEDLLALGLTFWQSKRVLQSVGRRTYAVLESLEADGGLAAGAAGGVASRAEDDEASASPRKSKNVDARESERRTIYWQFIVGMLTNSSPAMPLGQIAMMMKMLIADGCPWSNEELQEFLGEKVADGELELAGGKYRLAKK